MQTEDLLLKVELKFEAGVDLINGPIKTENDHISDCREHSIKIEDFEDINETFDSKLFQDTKIDIEITENPLIKMELGSNIDVQSNKEIENTRTEAPNNKRRELIVLLDRFNLDKGHTERDIINTSITNKVGLHRRQKLLFQCQECHRILATKYGLEGHIVSKHPKNKKIMNTLTKKVFSCENCEYKTVYSHNYNIHIQTHKEAEKENLQCDICGYQTLYKSSLKCHIQRHLGHLSYSCQICKKKFKSDEGLQCHLVAIHSKDEKAMRTVTKKIHYCDMCDFKTVKGRYMKEHVRTHKGAEEDKYFLCDICGYKTFRKSSLKCHIQKIHSSKRPLTCQICNKTYQSKRYLDNHIVAFHVQNKSMMNTLTNQLLFCNICEFKTVYSGKLKVHLKTHYAVKSDEVFECDMCGYKTKSKNDLEIHIKEHAGVVPFPCETCDIKFNSKRDLDNHIVENHVKDENAMSTVTCKLHSCKICEFKTANVQKFKMHLRLIHNIETEEKFRCDKCSYESAIKSNFKRHVLGHTTVFPFSCQICSKKFQFKRNLDGHIVGLHSKNQEAMISVTHKIYSCEMCDYMTLQNSKLKVHLHIHHGVEAEKLFQCNSCDYSSIRKDLMMRHIRRVHLKSTTVK